VSRKPLIVYSVGDSAIDIDAIGIKLRDYAQDRDPSVLRFVPGARPTAFHCRDIPTSLYQTWVMTGTTLEEQHRRAFQVGVSQVENLIEHTTGNPRQIVAPTDRMATGNGGATIATWSWDELELVSPIYQQEIGSVLLMRSAVPLGYAATYRLPHLSLFAYQTRLQRLADALRGERLQSSAASKAPQAPTDSGDGDAPTDATATERATSSSDESPTPSPMASSAAVSD
jgi:hypothetical protein